MNKTNKTVDRRVAAVSSGNGEELESISARIRYAREFRNIEPQGLRTRLKDIGLSVSKQLLHRYETVEARNPSLNIVAGIAEVTGFSPGWLLFGKGQVFIDDPFTQIVRAVNLEYLHRRPKKEWPSPAELKSPGVVARDIEHARARPFIVSIDDDFAHRIERATNKPIGWLDASPDARGRRGQARRMVDTLELIGEALKLTETPLKYSGCQSVSCVFFVPVAQCGRAVG